MAKPSPKKLGLVLSGGGARGAYEAGVLHYIRTMLPAKTRERQFDICTGASVGALNTAFVAATAHDLALQGREIHRLWSDVREENIYRRDRQALWEFLNKGSKSMFVNLLKRGSNKHKPHFNGFLDTAPFLPFIEKVIPWSHITANVKSGLIKAVSIVATNVFTGRTELFVEKHSSIEYTGEYITHFCKIEPLHAMASGAIPIVFPSVLVGDIAYTDGGLRLNTPMSPAIQLGADAVLVIGLHHRVKPGEKIPFHGVRGEPPALGQVLGRVMNSMFLDRIQYDIEQLERINNVISWAENLYGKNFLNDVNDMLVKKNIRGDIANRGLKRLKCLRIRPSKDIGEIFNYCYKRGKDKHFSLFEKFMVRLLDIDPTQGVDFLSYISFMPEYLKKLLDLGFEDARAQHSELKEFLEQ